MQAGESKRRSKGLLVLVLVLALAGAAILLGALLSGKGGKGPFSESDPGPSAASPAPSPTPVDPDPAAAPTPVRAHAKNGGLDFSIPLPPVSDPSLEYASFAGGKLLIFYFGPTCPHCQEALPQVQAFAEEIRGRGYRTLAIASSRSSAEEIREFITRYKCVLPVFWDEKRAFGDANGIRFLPTLFLVGSEGRLFRTDNFEGPSTLDTLRMNL